MKYDFLIDMKPIFCHPSKGQNHLIASISLCPWCILITIFVMLPSKHPFCLPSQLAIIVSFLFPQILNQTAETCAATYAEFIAKKHALRTNQKQQQKQSL